MISHAARAVGMVQRPRFSLLFNYIMVFSRPFVCWVSVVIYQCFVFFYLGFFVVSVANKLSGFSPRKNLSFGQRNFSARIKWKV